MNKEELHFFLGGKDLEMTAIKSLLEKEKVTYSDAGLAWGASTSKYGNEINKVALEGKTPILVELQVDSPLPENTLNIDHHNDRAGEPASILQVCEMLGVQPTRKMQLIAANDSGYIPAMKALDATSEEINQIRLLDRQSQGITAEQEQEAERAIAEKTEVYGVTVVRMKHSKTATVTDRLFDENKPQNLLIFSEDGEVNYFGNGLICKELQGNKTGKDENGYDTFDNFGGWNGGTGLGKSDGTAFWGGYPNHAEVLKFVINRNRELNQKEKSVPQQDMIMQNMMKNLGKNGR